MQKRLAPSTRKHRAVDGSVALVSNYYVLFPSGDALFFVTLCLILIHTTMASNNEKGVYDLIKELIDCRDESIKIYRFVAHATIQLKNREWKDPFIYNLLKEYTKAI